MKKVFKRIFKITLLTLLIGIATITVVILFPQHLFANKMNYKNFTVCSNNKIDDNLKTVLDNATTLIEKSELYNPDYKYNIILCYNTLYNKIHGKLLGNGPAAITTLSNIVVKVNIDAQKNLAFATFHKACEVNLTELLAHEITHSLQAKKYGIFKFNPFKHPEFWKLEGYPDYISKQQEFSHRDYNFGSDINRYVNLESKTTDIWILSEPGGCEVPKYYYKGRLMIQYLMDIKHLSYDQILKDTTSEKMIYQEMVNWNNNQQRDKN